MDLMERWSQKKELAVTTSYVLYLNTKRMCVIAQQLETTDLKGEIA